MALNTTPSLSADVAFDLLSNARRRYVIRRLDREPAGIELGELSTELAAWENNIDEDNITPQQRKRTYVSLYQTHIPKLEDAGIVAYDIDTGFVRPTNNLEEVLLYLESSNKSPSCQFYGFTALLGLIAYIFASVYNIPVINPTHLGLLVLIIIAVPSLIQYTMIRFDLN